MELEIELDQYKLTVEITRLVSDKPDPSCRDSADDFYGCKEVEWKLVYGIEFDEYTGKIKQCGELTKWLDRITTKHFGEIEAAIWAKYDEAQENRQ